MSADVLLSRLGLRYDGSGLKGSPAKIVANLLALTVAFDAGTYRTPDFVTAPLSSASFDPGNVAKRSTLRQAYDATVAAGNVTSAHKAVDKYNKLLMVMSGQELVPPSDFEIIAHQDSLLGAAARWIVEDTLEIGLDYDHFFEDHGAALRKYAKQK